MQCVITHISTDLQLHYISFFFVSVLFKELILTLYLSPSFKVNSKNSLVLINKTNVMRSTRSQM